LDPVIGESTNEQTEYVVGAYCEFGEGRCVFYSDASCMSDLIFRNSAGDIDVEDMVAGKKFVLNIASWLGNDGKRILLDQTHNELRFNRLGSSNSLSLFVNILSEFGYEINYFTVKGEIEEISSEVLVDCDMLFLLGALKSNNPGEDISRWGYSKNETIAIREFVRAGGGLFILCNGERESSGANDISDQYFNPLLKEFGVTLDSNIPELDSFKYDTWNYDLKFNIHPITNGISTLYKDRFIRSFIITDPSIPLIYLVKNSKTSPIEPEYFKRTYGGIIAAAGKFGAGRGVFFGSFWSLRDYHPPKYKDEWNEYHSSFQNLSINMANWVGRGGRRILIDQLHKQIRPSLINEGLKAFELELRDNGYDVIYNFESELNSNFSYDILKKFDIIILLGLINSESHSGAICRWSYTDQEINNITKFVNSGGGLVVMINNPRDDMGASNDIYNKITKNFGVKYNNDSLESGGILHVSDHPVTKNVKHFRHNRMTTLSLTGNTSAIMYVKEITYESNNILDIARLIIIILILLATFSFMLIRYLGTELGKYKFYCFISPLYSKLKKERLLDNKTRGRIRKHIQAHPGAHYNELKRNLNISNGTLAYHLMTLERGGFIRSKKEGMYKILYPKESTEDEAKRPHLGKSRKEIQDIIQETPGLTQKEISKKTKLSLSTVNYHISSMIEDDLIRVERSGNETRCYPIEEAMNYFS
jgi:predicted transcriptional regulator